MIAADKLAAMVKDAVAKHKPRNGKQLVIGFANLQRDITFCAKVEQGLVANAKAAGIDLQIADNRLDGATALANAESFLQRGVDYVIEFQTDANFGATIMSKMKAADTKVTAIDIPMPGATFFGANNPRSGFMGGSYLGQAALAKWGADKVKTGYLIVGELPQSGAIPAMRTGGQIAGFLSTVAGFPAANVIKIDTKNNARGKLRPDQQRAGPDTRGRADHGNRHQRPVGYGHPARREAGRPRGGPPCRRNGRGRRRDAGGRARIRRFGRLLP